MNISQALTMATCVALLMSGASCSSPSRKPAERSKKKVEPRAPRMNVRWDEVRKNPASIEVLLMHPTSLVETNDTQNGWLRVPEQFKSFHTTIYLPDKPMMGVADYRVTRDGYLFVACNYEYQGNSSGDWTESRWMRDDFYAHGWRTATSTNLNGVLVNGSNREYMIFVKKVSAGESGRLRCNKYEPPLFIITSNEKVEGK